jgi:hypothetical protein
MCFSIKEKLYFFVSKQFPKFFVPRQLIHPPIDKSGAWVIMDGASQCNPIKSEMKALFT